MGAVAAEVLATWLALFEQADDLYNSLPSNLRDHISERDGGDVGALLDLPFFLARLGPKMRKEVENGLRTALGYVSGQVEEATSLNKDDVSILIGVVRMLSKLGPRSKDQLGYFLEHHNGVAVLHANGDKRECRFSFRLPPDLHRDLEL